MDPGLWKSKEEVRKYLDNLGTEYRYGCFEEKNSESCHLLADYLLAIERSQEKAAKLYKVNCNERNNGLSCDAYGRLLFKGEGVEKADYEEAFKYFKKGCDLDDPRACYHGGQLVGIVDHGINIRVKPDPDKAIEMLDKSCMSKKQPSACVLIHSLFLRGFHGKPPDLKKAAHYAKLACDQGKLDGCYNLSRMYHLGDGFDAPNPELAKHYFNLAKQISKGTKFIGQATPDRGSDI